MRKAWHIVSMLAMACVLLGIVGIAVGFFTGSSPTILQNHGHIQQYGERLALNWNIFRRDVAHLLAMIGL